MVQLLCLIAILNLLFRSRIEADLGLGFYKLKMPKGRYVDTLTINWHITEACNFQCKYCFAKWTRHDQKEILHMPSKVELLLEEISQLPSLLDFKVLRLNLVGGEIFLYPKPLLHILQEAKTRNMHLSAITNGSFKSAFKRTHCNLF
ncbi:radical SAM protein [Helicobacter felis]|uniref:radical SAM protein n=1 Tax=Helicobacter felis TaxID=214 RepID=UPI0018F7F635|nr:radical SAM protein [Helicobacter felis]